MEDRVAPKPAPVIKFGTDGWRAIIAEDFTFDNVRLCAQALSDELVASEAAGQGLVVAYDTRFASERFAEAVAEVAAANGIRVSLTNVATPTPAASFAVTRKKAAAGVVITASHNPGAYNGFKIKSALGGSASPEAVAKVEERLGAILSSGRAPQRIPFKDAVARGLVSEFDPSEAFLKRLEELVDIDRIRGSNLRIVVDSMFGAGAGFLPRVLSGGKIDVLEINGHRNPAFPGIAQPEPIAANLARLSETVKERHADAGIALDGDADRVGLIDEHGQYVTTLEAFSLIAHHLLRDRQERGAIVCTITMSSMVDRLGDLYGVEIHRTPVGFKYVGPKMLETNAMLGGEESGGYAFRGHVPERDGILSGLMILEAMVSTGKRPSQLMADLHGVTGPHVFKRVDIEFDAPRRAEIQQRVADLSPESMAGLNVANMDRRDGVRIEFEGGSWAVIRFSGTEPLLRTYAEAHDAATVDSLVEELRRVTSV